MSPDLRSKLKSISFQRIYLFFKRECNFYDDLFGFHQICIRQIFLPSKLVYVLTLLTAGPLNSNSTFLSSELSSLSSYFSRLSCLHETSSYKALVAVFFIQVKALFSMLFTLPIFGVHSDILTSWLLHNCILRHRTSAYRSALTLGLFRFRTAQNEIFKLFFRTLFLSSFCNLASLVFLAVFHQSLTVRFNGFYVSTFKLGV